MSSKVVLVGGGQPTKELDLFAMKTDLPEGADLSGYALKGTVEIGTAPASATATGVAGTAVFTATGMYVCVATDTWVRVALATWS